MAKRTQQRGRQTQRQKQRQTQRQSLTLRGGFPFFTRKAKRQIAPESIPEPTYTDNLKETLNLNLKDANIRKAYGLEYNPEETKVKKPFFSNFFAKSHQGTEHGILKDAYARLDPRLKEVYENKLDGSKPIDEIYTYIKGLSPTQYKNVFLFLDTSNRTFEYLHKLRVAEILKHHDLKEIAPKVQDSLRQYVYKWVVPPLEDRFTRRQANIKKEHKYSLFFGNKEAKAKLKTAQELDNASELMNKAVLQKNTTMVESSQEDFNRKFVNKLSMQYMKDQLEECQAGYHGTEKNKCLEDTLDEFFDYIYGEDTFTSNRETLEYLLNNHRIQLNLSPENVEFLKTLLATKYKNFNVVAEDYMNKKGGNRRQRKEKRTRRHM